MASLRILLIHNVLWSHYKAAVFNELSRLCAESGHSFKVIHIAETEFTRKALGDVDTMLSRYPHEVIHPGLFEEVTFQKKILSLLNIIIKYHPDVLLVPGYFDGSWILAAYIAKVFGCKIIMASDSTQYDSPRYWIKEAIKKIIMKPFDMFFCYGSMSRMYLKSLGVPESKIIIRYQSTQNNEIIRIYQATKNNHRSNFSKKNIIYAGRLSKEKNLLSLLKIFSEIANINWGLIIVGSGPQESELKKYVSENNISNVYFVGPKSWREVIPYYASADCLVLPSLSEPWGLVVNEAMLCKLPVVVSSHCGASGNLVYEGENGFIFDPNSEQELNYNLTAIMDNRYDLVQMGLRSFELIQEYSPEKSAQQMFEGILEVSQSTCSL